MSGNGYGYYYPQTSQNYQMNQNPQWSQWTIEQQQFNRSNIQQYNNKINPINQLNRKQNFYNNGTNRHYQPQRRYNQTQFPNPGTWQPRQPFKRPRQDNSVLDVNEAKSKTAKKRKKPLSQNIPSKKDWSVEDAQKALSVEKGHNKRFKNHSLIIKFPDLELNRDIVTNFHPSIENVHFQQPSTPRFCFVTLHESADAEAVIGSLNQIKFGDGLLTAEYKKDREEDQNIGPEDIDPTTLYVGNLAQDITKEDMVKTYPTARRIDIGYAKKMKYTRYAFVSFKNAIDAIEAFKTTHSTQMHSKSLIVRFRRLHGTVGMPGETKPQSPTKKTTNSSNLNETSNLSEHNDISINSDNTNVANIDLSLVKREMSSDDEDEDYDGCYSKFTTRQLNFNKTNIKKEIDKSVKVKVETEKSNDDVDDVEEELPPILPPVESLIPPLCFGSNLSNNKEVDVKPELIKKETDIKVKWESIENTEDEDKLLDDGEDDEDIDRQINFEDMLHNLDDHSKQIASLKTVP